MVKKKHEWRKSEKGLYLPKAQPVFINVPAMQFITIEGEGNPAAPAYAECIQALYSVSYAIKMNLKKVPHRFDNYLDYTVYPLEGIWDLNEAGRKAYAFDSTLDKNNLVYKIMIRQPDFVDQNYYDEMLTFTKSKKPQGNLNSLKFETIEEGKCIQMLHVGSFDNEPETFAIMEAFALAQGYLRKSKVHKEIYLSDFRKTSEEKLKTVLRFGVEE